VAQLTEEAYTNGVLKPKEALVLRESQRVRRIVRVTDDGTGREGRPATSARFRAGIENMKFLSRERLPSRGELHDRP
jgi:predicted DNA-binding antitoxin AbrB/MazE fold protein